MPCFFCRSSKHFTQNCNIYPTLASRYSKLNYSIVPCLCRKGRNIKYKFLVLEDCKCKIFCEICFQPHHVALCPRKDPNHPCFSNDHTDSLNFFSLDYSVIKRFLNLCIPVDKIKMHLSCKHLSRLQPLNYKLYHSNYQTSFKENTICTGRADIVGKNDIHLLRKNIYFNFHILHIKNRCLTKADLNVLAKNNLLYVFFENCTYENSITYSSVLKILPYALGFAFTYDMLPSTWIKDLINAKRSINIRYLNICTNGVYPEINVHELVELFKVHKDLVLVFEMGFDLNFTIAWKKLETIMNHERFAVTSNPLQTYVVFIIGNSSMYFGFNTSDLP